MSNYEIHNADGKRKVLISKYAKKWEVMLFVIAPFIDDFVLCGGCDDPILYTIYTQQDLNRFVSNYLETGTIRVTANS